jgi:hypothetical protein
MTIAAVNVERSERWAISPRAMRRLIRLIAGIGVAALAWRGWRRLAAANLTPTEAIAIAALSVAGLTLVMVLQMLIHGGGDGGGGDPGGSAPGGWRRYVKD